MKRTSRVLQAVLYYWQGTRRSGRWIECVATDLGKTRRDLESAGYVCVAGDTASGPPSAPPEASAFEAIGL